MVVTEESKALCDSLNELEDGKLEEEIGEDEDEIDVDVEVAADDDIEADVVDEVINKDVGNTDDVEEET